uniref:Macaca fascicularis brain cDNA, clone: QflA-16149 n=1 Tax=Macaca fascicularis TaxID=9541 RepID=I7GKX4_MACFA|nr:unnamed protein product [Macaca fascicularis]
MTLFDVHNYQHPKGFLPLSTCALNSKTKIGIQNA